MKLAIIALLAGCVRTVVAPATPVDPKATYHVAEDNLLKSAQAPATCERVYATPTYDSARCSFANGYIVYGWSSAEHGFGFVMLQQPPAKPAPVVEQPKSPEPTKADPPKQEPKKK